MIVRYLDRPRRIAVTLLGKNARTIPCHSLLQSFHLVSKITLVATLLGAGLVCAQTVDEIIAKNIQARGGLEKIKAVRTIRVTGKIDQGGFRAGFVQENLRPGKVREEFLIQGMAQIQAFDGKSAWQVSPFGGRKDPDLMSADDRKALVQDADIDGQLVDYKNKDHRAELIGHDSVEGTDCYKIKLSLSNGDVRYYYIDTDSFLELKIENERNIRGAVQYSEMYFGDYEQVNGIYFPFAYEAGEKGSSFRVRYTVDKIDLNVPIGEDRFMMPKVGGSK